MSDVVFGIFIGFALLFCLYMTHGAARNFAVNDIAYECNKYGVAKIGYQRFECKAIEDK